MGEGGTAWCLMEWDTPGPLCAKMVHANPFVFLTLRIQISPYRTKEHFKVSMSLAVTDGPGGNLSALCVFVCLYLCVCVCTCTHAHS